MITPGSQCNAIDIQIRDPYSTNLKTYTFTAEDRQLLVDLLHEYSYKLVAISQDLEIANSRSGWKSVLLAIGATLRFILHLSLVLDLIALIIILMLFIKQKYLLYLAKELETIDIVLVIGFLMVFMMLCASVLLLLDRNEISEHNTGNRVLLQKQARRIADKLTKVRQVVVEIDPKLEMNLSRKLELDLRVNDVMLAITYYQTVEREDLMND